MSTTSHPFEAAGLGRAPFRFLRAVERVFQCAPGEPMRAGGSCQYCGMGIRYACVIGSSDGRSFDVGRECVHKTDPALYDLYKTELRAIRLASLQAARARYEAANTEARRREREAEALRLEANEASFRASQPDVASMIDALSKQPGYAGRVAQRALSDARHYGRVQNEPSTLRGASYPTLDKLRESYFEQVADGHVGVHGQRQTLCAEYLGTTSFETAYGTSRLRKFIVQREDGSHGLLVWKTSASLMYDGDHVTESYEHIVPGTALEITAKFEFAVYQGHKQTRLTRPKFRRAAR